LLFIARLRHQRSARRRPGGRERRARRVAAGARRILPAL